MSKVRNCPACGHELEDAAASARVSRYLAEEGQRRDELFENARRAADANAQKLVRARLAEAERAREGAVAAATSTATAAERKRHAAERAQMQKRMEEMTRQLERRTADEQGQVGEATVLESLQRAFPTDVVTALPKRRAHGDIKHEIRDGNRTCGVIVYECKNVQQWSAGGVMQARAARNTHNTEHVVLVSNVFPKGERHLCFVRDIPVVHAALLVHFVRHMREAIIAISRTSSTAPERQRKADLLLAFVQSEDFVRHMRVLADEVEELRADQLKERSSHELMWEKRETRFAAIVAARAKLSARIEVIIAGPRLAIAKTEPVPEVQRFGAQT